MSIRVGIDDVGIAWYSSEVGHRARPFTEGGGTWLNLGSSVTAVFVAVLCRIVVVSNDNGMVGKGASNIANPGPGCGSVGHGHLVEGVSLFSANVGRMCGITSGWVKNATIGAQYASGFVFHSSFDKSTCRRGTWGVLLRSPHNRVVQVLCGATNELFKQIVCDVPVFIRNRG